MRIVIDENLPADLAVELAGHKVTTVSRLGWRGVKNGELLLRAQGRFDVLLTMDRNLEFQQNLAGTEIAIVLLIARSNRMNDLRPLIPAILLALGTLKPGELRRIGP